MGRNFIIILFSLFAFMGGLHAQSIDFQDPYWEELIEQADSEDKYLFVDAYTSWCAPCKKMSKEVFTVDSVAEFYNEQFVCTKLDMESKDGKKFAERYQVKAYPTFLIINGKGDVVARTCGYKPAPAFLEFGKQALLAEVTLTEMNNRYNNAERNPEFLYNYFKALKTGCFPFVPMVEEHLNGKMPVELAGSANWRMFSEYIFDLGTPVAQLFLQQPTVFINVYGKEAVEAKVIALYQNHISNNYSKAKKNEAKTIHEAFQQEVKQVNTLWREHITELDELYFQEAQANWNAYATSARNRLIISRKNQQQ